MGGTTVNRTKIEWTDYSWNPITGCKHDCWYCYAKRLTQRFKKIFPNGFEPTFYPERLKEPWELKKPSKIFVCSISDLFASWTPKEWRDAVLNSLEKCPIQHIFQLLTKQPHLISKEYCFPNNVWVGATVTNEFETWKIDELRERILCNTIFVSFEPLLGHIEPDLNGVQWVIVGKLTGSKKIKLKNDWLIEIREACRFYRVPLFEKNNLGLKNPIQEFPKGGKAVG